MGRSARRRRHQHELQQPGLLGALQAAIDYAWDHDVVVVAATGNDGSSSRHVPRRRPRRHRRLRHRPSDALAPSSNYGPDVFLAAPGVDILTTAPGGGTTSVTGTSASSAIVAAAAGLLRAADPAASNGVIVGRLARNATNMRLSLQRGTGSLGETLTGTIRTVNGIPDQLSLPINLTN